MSREAMEAFQVEWEDAEDFSKGFKYLFVDDATKEKLKGSVVTVEEAANKHRITDVIGLQHGLGVENLSGSGMIAGETSRAYEEVFTATLVTGRSVGIGAYLVRCFPLSSSLVSPSPPSPFLSPSSSPFLYLIPSLHSPLSLSLFLHLSLPLSRPLSTSLDLSSVSLFSLSVSRPLSLPSSLTLYLFSSLPLPLISPHSRTHTPWSP